MNFEAFAGAAARLTTDMVEALGQADNAKITEAMLQGARLKLSCTMDASGRALVALDLVDAAGAEHRVMHVEGRPPTKN